MKGVRRLAAGDEQTLAEFLSALPLGDRTFIKEDISEPGTAAAWIADTDSVRAIASGPEGISGLVAIIPGVGWSSHVADVRLVVLPAERRRGVGTQLARWAVMEAARMGFKKLVIEVVAEQEAAVAMFLGLGFEPEALLQDHIRDHGGNFRDLLVLGHRVDDNWSGLSTVGFET